MKVRVAGQEITKWENLTLTLRFDSVKSVFSMDMYWNPFDKKMRLVMLPGGYNTVIIVSDNEQVLFTGIFINPSFKSSSKPCLVNLSGYSLTGVLEDVEYSAIFSDSTQINGKSFFYICQTVCNKLGLRVKDNTGGQAKRIITTKDLKADTIIERNEPDREQSIADYLSDLAKGLNIVLSHNEHGDLVLNYNLGDSDAVFNFSQGMPGVEYELSLDGSQMHSEITAAAQAGYVGEKPAPVTVKNPFVAPQSFFNYRTAGINLPAINSKYLLNGSSLQLQVSSMLGINLPAINSKYLVNGPSPQPQVLNVFNVGYRPHSVTQTDTDAPNLEDVANQALADELTAIRLSITIDRWELNNKLVPTGSIVSVQNPELYLFNKANFFIYQITYSGDAAESTATYLCTIPEAFNGKVPTKSIFYGTNFTNFVEENPPLRSDDRKGVLNNHTPNL